MGRESYIDIFAIFHSGRLRSNDLFPCKDFSFFLEEPV